MVIIAATTNDRGPQKNCFFRNTSGKEEEEVGEEGGGKEARQEKAQKKTIWDLLREGVPNLQQSLIPCTRQRRFGSDNASRRGRIPSTTGRTESAGLPYGPG